MSTANVDELRAAALRQPGARERSTGIIKFQCPQCAAEGHDKHEDNAGFFVHDGKWGCAFVERDSTLGRAHWEAIGRALGALNGHSKAGVATSPPMDHEDVVHEDENAVVAPAVARPVKLPPGFIQRYVEVAARRTDAPLEAHALTAI